jgi:uncharacterized membrane protein
MTRRSALVVSAVLVIVMLMVSAYAWTVLPDGRPIPTHFDAAGRPNGYGGKFTALLLLPLIGAGLSALMYVLPRLDPRGRNLEESGPAYPAIWIAVVAFLALIHFTLVANALGHAMNIALVSSAGIGLLLLVMGAFLGRLRANWFIGIRTPWTLSSDLSWERTHRVGGYAFMALGILLLGGAVLGVFLPVLLLGLVLIVAGLTVYSYLVWRADPEARRA